LKIKILALGLILVGGLGLLYGRSTDSRETYEASVGPNDPSVHGETVNFTDLAGIIVVLLGGGLLFSPGKRSGR
jgi:hypothetical protein